MPLKFAGRTMTAIAIICAAYLTTGPSVAVTAEVAGRSACYAASRSRSIQTGT